MKKAIILIVVMILSSCQTENEEYSNNETNYDETIENEVSNSEFIQRKLIISDLRNISSLLTDKYTDSDFFDGSQNIESYQEVLVFASNQFIETNYGLEVEEFHLTREINEIGQRFTFVRFDLSSRANFFLDSAADNWIDSESGTNVLTFFDRDGVLIISNFIDDNIRNRIASIQGERVEIISFIDVFKVYQVDRILLINQADRMPLDISELIDPMSSDIYYDVELLRYSDSILFEYLTVPSSFELVRILDNFDDLISQPLITRDIIQSYAEINLSSIEDISSDLDVCRLETNETHGDGSQIGFPYVEPFIANRGVVNVLVAPIDFPRYRGDKSYLDGLKEDVSRINDWASFFSGGKMKYNLVVLEDWTLYSKGENYFPIYGNAFQNNLQDPRQTKIEIISLLSERTDIETIDMFYLIFPSELLMEIRVSLYGKDILVLQNGTEIKTAFYGNERYENTIGTYWNHLLHETLHFQGFVGHGPGRNWDSSYSVMNNADDGAIGIMSWEAFLVGWFDDEDINCISKDNLSIPRNIKIDSIDQYGASGGPKSIMIPLNETKILVIEYRTTGEFSKLRRDRMGIISYVVDVSKKSLYPGGPENQLDLDKVNFWFHLYSDNESLNPVFDLGDYYIYDGVRVEIIGEGIVEVSLEN